MIVRKEAKKMDEERIIAIIARIKDIMKEEGRNEALYTIDGDLTLIISDDCKYISREMIDRIGEYKGEVDRMDFGGAYDMDEDALKDFSSLENVYMDLELIDNIDIDAVFGSTRLDLEALHELKEDREEIAAYAPRQQRTRRNRTREEEEVYER